MDPDKIMDGLSKELNSALRAMAKAKDVNENPNHKRRPSGFDKSLLQYVPPRGIQYWLGGIGSLIRAVDPMEPIMI
jgi:hypothetical protein